jgi:4'-phosphopantetheinyl transferase
VLLAGQLSCAPDEVDMVTGDHGKPRLEHSELRFNASRSAGVALYATSWTTEVGVDVEAIRSDVDMDEIAALFFTTEEQRALASLPPADRLVASFQCWTRKEAYLKGLGVGVTSLPLRDVEVGVGVVGADSAATVPPAIVSGWSIRPVDVAPGFAAAVAASGIEGWAPVTPRLIGGDGR